MTKSYVINRIDRVDRMNGIVSILIVVISLGFLACGSGSAQRAKSYDNDCVKPAMREVLLRWGDWSDSSTVLDGYEIDAQGRIFKYSASEHSTKYLRDSIGTIEKATFCYYADTIRKTFLRIQSLTVRAPNMRYIEYQNPMSEVSLRAVWDRRFETFGSTEFRAIFDSLSTLTPQGRK